jgi:hypothetical protein
MTVPMLASMTARHKRRAVSIFVPLLKGKCERTIQPSSKALALSIQNDSPDISISMQVLKDLLHLLPKLRAERIDGLAVESDTDDIWRCPFEQVALGCAEGGVGLRVACA